MLGLLGTEKPRTFLIAVNAGRFNFSWNNPNGRRWEFPAGTVLYSDGVTAITESTAEKPDVTIPAGGGIVRLDTAAWGGNFSLGDNDTNAGYVGKLIDIPEITYLLNLSSCTNITGSLADLQGKITYQLRLDNCANITGSLADLQGKITYYLDITNCTNITGSLADLQGKITYYLNLNGCTNITGSLADLQGKITHYLNLTNCTNITGVYTPVGTGTPTITILSNTGLSSADMDNTLIAYAAGVKNNGTFTATGKTRTAASDAAVATLGGRGWTITGITKV